MNIQYDLQANIENIENIENNANEKINIKLKLIFLLFLNFFYLLICLFA